MRQWLGIDALAAFTLRRIEARGWHVSVHFVNETVEMHAVTLSEPTEIQIARCNDGMGNLEQRRAAKLLATAVGLADVV